MITLYTKNNCPYCKMTKTLLGENGLSFREINIEEIHTAREFLIENGHKTVPQIYFNNEILVEGGFTGLSNVDFDLLKQRVFVEAA